MPRNLSLTFVLALCTMMGALGIDTYLPSFHAIAQEFAVGPAAVQQTLSVYVLAMAITMLFYGTLSDTFGRRRVLVFASLGFAITSTVAALVQSIEALIAVRCAQGAMAGAGMVIARAIVQDRFHGADAQRMMSMVMFCFGLAPAIAPVFGGWLQAHGGWRAAFFFLTGFGLLLTLLCWRVLPETLPPDKRVPLHLRVIAGNYLTALRHRQFRRMVAGLALMAGANAIYISAAAEFVMGILRLEETSFGWLFIPLIGGSMLGSAISGVLAKQIAPRVQQRIGYGALLLGCASNVLYHLLTDMPVVPWAVLPIACYTLGLALLMPILSLQVMALFPDMRGLASSLQGFTQMSVFAIMAGAVVPQLFHSGLALALGQCITVVCGMLVWWWSQRSAAAQDAPQS
ncbi:MULTISPECIES: multidrug effflux MFS transporter [Comamonas]|jgi:DHA1 family bicyclomycin/chloramphenicol resistance-like MFS transporter|uniref:Bcr/CflA family efflux transporter n=1 Tax=Comamonas aquatica TaxID=225991 RepID=A0AA42HSA1_9BURK|nr:multidrug effflux MFS transporter [Comamonas aquatica]MDE1555314.1 multidrug effflux MFS transporter [Comamonas aquatica]MDH0363654.1 multidrug effflux MFS transporter [Comamonas aquatica]MDH1765081.1 multidrug effflux MFS transporter [Comamonas aquatica]